MENVEIVQFFSTDSIIVLIFHFIGMVFPFAILKKLVSSEMKMLFY